MSANVCEDIWHSLFILRLAEMANRAVLQRQAINCKPLTKKALRRLENEKPLRSSWTATAEGFNSSFGTIKGIV